LNFGPYRKGLFIEGQAVKAQARLRILKNSSSTFTVYKTTTGVHIPLNENRRMGCFVQGFLAPSGI
jgi:hypothetical protein